MKRALSFGAISIATIALAITNSLNLSYLQLAYLVSGTTVLLIALFLLIFDNTENDGMGIQRAIGLYLMALGLMVSALGYNSDRELPLVGQFFSTTRSTIYALGGTGLALITTLATLVEFGSTIANKLWEGFPGEFARRFLRWVDLSLAQWLVFIGIAILVFLGLLLFRLAADVQNERYGILAVPALLITTMTSIQWLCKRRRFADIIALLLLGLTFILLALSINTSPFEALPSTFLFILGIAAELTAISRLPQYFIQN